MTDEFLAGPFGQPDGAMADITELRGDAVNLPPRYGAVARSPGDPKIRVVVGARGSGKSFFLARMREARSDSKSTHASYIQRNEDLLTPLVVDFARTMQIKDGNTELWTMLWRRAIFMSAWSFIRNVDSLKPNPKEASDQSRAEAFGRIEDGFWKLIGNPDTPRRVSSRAAYIIREHPTFPTMQQYLMDDGWEDIEELLRRILHDSPELFLFIDDIDRNYAWAPTLWSQCQRGLFYAVMELLREDVFRSKLHVVVALRDVTLAAVTGGEHATRYIERLHISELSWSQRSIEYLLDQKIKRLPDEFFLKSDRSAASWLGLASVTPARPGARAEPLEDYLIRHTRVLPRDVVVLGNALCEFITEHGHQRLTQSELRRIVGDTSRRILRSELAACLNELRYSGQKPVKDNYDEAPTPEQSSPTVRAQVDQLIEAIGQLGVEQFTPELLAIFESITADFGGGAQLSNILWQHRVLCWVDGAGGFHFFEPDEYFGRSDLPRGQQIGAYQWHCMVHDISPGLEVNGSEPACPG